MNDAVKKMLARYECTSLNDHIIALREILQEMALLGLWRAKFFENAAFYGGTALRILYGLDRFSEDLDFSLLKPMKSFDLTQYTQALKKEIAAFGFDVQVNDRPRNEETQIQSAFLKANTIRQLLVIQTPEPLVGRIHRAQNIKIKLEVDTDPPMDFETEARYLLQPIPFAVRAYTLPDLFAGKMHAVLCRRWEHRSKGRDWYDLVWYVGNDTGLHLGHLEQRMRQSGDWAGDGPLTFENFKTLLKETIERLDIGQIKRDVEPFVKHPETLSLWSRAFFTDVAGQIKVV